MTTTVLASTDRLSLATAGSFAKLSNDSLLNFWIFLGYYIRYSLSLDTIPLVLGSRQSWLCSRIRWRTYHSSILITRIYRVRHRKQRGHCSVYVETRLIQMIHTLNMLKHEFAISDSVVPDLSRLSA